MAAFVKTAVSNDTLTRYRPISYYGSHPQKPHKTNQNYFDNFLSGVSHKGRYPILLTNSLEKFRKSRLFKNSKWWKSCHAEVDMHTII